MKKVLLTGGAGFIGHHSIEHFLKKTDWQILRWFQIPKYRMFKRYVL